MLRLEIDRTLRLAGEPGQVALAATCPRGDVELVPEMAKFASSDSGVVKVDAKLGTFQARSPGKTTMTGSHAAAKQPATVGLHVYDPAKARLVFDPAAVRLAVNEQARLPLYLEASEGGKTERAAMEGPGGGLFAGPTEAVRWSPPTLVAAGPRRQFPLTAGDSPFLKGTATAQVEVLPAAEPGEFAQSSPRRSLAPGQTVSLAVEQQLPGSDQWKDVFGPTP